MDKENAIKALQALITDLDNRRIPLIAWEGSATDTLKHIYPDRKFNIKDQKVFYYGMDGESANREEYKEFIKGILRNIELMGIPAGPQSSPQNLINIHQHVNVSFILEGLKHFLTDEDFQELKNEYEKGRTTAEKKNNLLSKIKSFGSDVASNILANILTNPNIWMGS